MDIKEKISLEAREIMCEEIKKLKEMKFFLEVFQMKTE